MAEKKKSTPEQEKGHTTYKVLLATGKQKAIDMLDAFFNGMIQRGELTILDRKQTHKAKLLRHYEELKVIFATNQPHGSVDAETVAALDYLNVTEKAPVIIGASSYRERDEWLKWNIKEQTAQFQLRGGILEIDEEKEHKDNNVVLRTCHYSLQGELALAVKYRDRLLDQGYCNPDTLSYEV